MKHTKIVNLLVALSTINSFGSALTWTGLPILAFYLTGSPLFTSFLFITSSIARIVTTFFGGYYVDKYKKITIMIICIVGSIFTFSFLYLAIKQELFYLLVPLMVLNGLFGSANALAQNIWMNKLIEGDNLVKHISARNSWFLSAKTLGFGLGPVFFKLFMANALLFDLATYVISLGIVLFIQKYYVKDETIDAISDRNPTKILNQLKESFVSVWKSKTLSELSILETINGMITPIIISVSVFVLDLRYDASTAVFSGFWIIGGIGSILANMLLSKVDVYKWSKLQLLITSNALIVGGLIMMTVSPVPIYYLIGFSLFTFGTPIINNLLRAEIFIKAPKHMKAKYKSITIALSDISKLIFIPISYLIIDKFGVVSFLVIFTLLSLFRVNYSFKILLSNEKTIHEEGDSIA